MAQIQEEHVVIKVSQLVRDGAPAEPRINEEITQSLEAVVTELVGDGCVVEVAALEE